MPSPRYAREIPQRYRLEGAQCAACGKRHFPPRKICPACKKTEMRAVPLAREGSVVTWTVVHAAPEPFARQAPYAIGIVQLDDGVRLTAPIIDCAPDELQIGSRVRAVFRRLAQEGDGGIIHYGHKFALVRPGE